MVLRKIFVCKIPVFEIFAKRQSVRHNQELTKSNANIRHTHTHILSQREQQLISVFVMFYKM